jgi:radical SAM/Cys-rich protein
MLDSKPLLFPTDFPPLARRALDTLQLNLGYRCNQSCVHCHVDAGPKRPEVMSRETVDAALAFLTRERPRTLDLTGGAPELNPEFRRLVHEAHALGLHLIDRCNLTILEEPGQEDLAAFLAAHGVEVVASLPCYLEENVDGQRGKGVFTTSIRALRRLNALGYGDGASGLTLSLVYNPTGPYLPPPQCGLEADYKRMLGERHGVHFDRLLTLANMPIRRFGSLLQSQGRFDEYLGLLKSAHSDENLEAVMCRNLVSVDWRGLVYDCDFNQMLDLPLRSDGRPLHIADLDGSTLSSLHIQVGEHCYGCTAGQGSSCGGALSPAPDPSSA